MTRRSAQRLRIAKRRKSKADGRIQPLLVLPRESHEADEDPLLNQYVKMGETALKNSSDLEEEDVA